MLLTCKAGKTHPPGRLIPYCRRPGYRARCIAWSTDSSAIYYSLENKQAKVFQQVWHLQRRIPTCGGWRFHQPGAAQRFRQLALIAQSPSLPARILVLQDSQTRIAARSRADDLHPADSPSAQGSGLISSTGARVYALTTPLLTVISARRVCPFGRLHSRRPDLCGAHRLQPDTAFFTSRGHAHSR